MNRRNSTIRPITKDWKIALAWLLILTGCSLSGTATAQSSTQQMQRLYVTALEDSLILLQAIRPAYRNLQIVTKLQNEFLFTVRLRDLQIKELELSIEKERKKRISATIKSFGVGLLIGLIGGMVF
jgi:hypothetical protein